MRSRYPCYRPLMARPKLKGPMVGCRLPLSTHQRLLERASYLGCSVSSLVERAIIAELDQALSVSHPVISTDPLQAQMPLTRTVPANTDNRIEPAHLQARRMRANEVAREVADLLTEAEASVALDGDTHSHPLASNACSDGKHKPAVANSGATRCLKCPAIRRLDGKWYT